MADTSTAPATGPGTPGPVAEATGISKRFGATVALRDARITIAPGESHALVGRNGAGKSTLVSILTGLQHPDTGELRAFARDVLGPLADGTTESANLRETLQVLLDTNFNVAEAARLQFFHYNTMRYRVSKLERLLGPLSSDPHLRLDVAVALRVLEIAG